MESGIAALVRKQFVRPERSDLPAVEALAFRHLLIRDTAYQSIPKQLRADLHECFADWLERMAGGGVAGQEEIVAHHLEQAYGVVRRWGLSGSAPSSWRHGPGPSSSRPP